MLEYDEQERLEIENDSYDPYSGDVPRDPVDDANDDEKMLTGNDFVKFTPVLYRLTKQIIKNNEIQYRKFQRESNYLDRKNFKNSIN